ncbi:MAG: hypothetical protein IJA42_05705 [Bacteroidales bacterium]|nr:hypothetical protein [Bacteroidales bacterium]
MRKTKLIKQIINENQHNIAFIIGNGIHYQYHDCDISWEELLKSLWEEYNGDCDIDLKHLKGISFTEFYDIIEMNAYNEQRSRWNFNKLASLQQNIELSPKDLKNYSSSDVLQLALKHNVMSYIDNLNNNSDIIRKFHNKLVETSRTWCNDNFENASELSDKMCMQQFTDVTLNETKINTLKNSVKRNIANKFPKKENYNLIECTNFIKKLNVPILTTNFDTYLSDSLPGLTKRYIYLPKVNYRVFLPIF